MSPRPFWTDSYESAVDALMGRLEGDVWRARMEGGGPGDVLDRVLKDLGGSAHRMLRGRLVDAGWVEKAQTWSHPEDITTDQLAA